MPTQTVKTRVMKAGGKVPKWNQKFDVEVQDTADEVYISIFDLDMDDGTNTLVSSFDDDLIC